MEKKHVKKESNYFPARKIKFMIYLFFFLACLLLFGVTYARYTTSIEGTKEIRLSATTFNIIFDDGNESISLTNEGPKSDAEGLQNDPYTFTLENDSKLDTENRIYFSNITSTIPAKYLKFAIKIQRETDENVAQFSAPMTLESLGEPDENGRYLIYPTGNNTFLLPAHESFACTIVMWISSDMPNEENNVNLMNTSFRGKVVVETNQYIEEES